MLAGTGRLFTSSLCGRVARGDGATARVLVQVPPPVVTPGVLAEDCLASASPRLSLPPVCDQLDDLRRSLRSPLRI